MSRKQRRQNRQRLAGQGGSRPGPLADGVADLKTATPSTATPERWVGLAEIAERIGVCVRTIRNWRDRGLLPVRRLHRQGGPLGMLESELVAFLKSSCEASTDGQSCS